MQIERGLASVEIERMKQKMTSLSTAPKGMAVIAMLFSMQACGSETEQTLVAGFKACVQQDHPARRTNHTSVGQVDHCDAEPDLPPEWTLLTNWGANPKWLTPTSLVFVSNTVGDVYEMDIQSGRAFFPDGRWPS